MSGADSRDLRDPLWDAQVFFVGADGASLQALAEGPAVTANCQTLRNRELGQLCQTQKWLKRYKTGMFANLANLANVFSRNRPAADFNPRLAADLVARLAWPPFGKTLCKRRQASVRIRRGQLTLIRTPTQRGEVQSVGSGCAVADRHGAERCRTGWDFPIQNVLRSDFREGRKWGSMTPPFL